MESCETYKVCFCSKTDLRRKQATFYSSSKHNYWLGNRARSSIRCRSQARKPTSHKYGEFQNWFWYCTSFQSGIPWL